jgi:hypothetical protein
MSRSGGPGTLAMGAAASSSSPCPAGRHHFATFQLPPAPSPRLAANRPPPVLMTKSAPAEGLEYLGGGGLVTAMSRNNNNNINSNSSSSSRLELTNKNRNDNADSHGTDTLSKGLLHFYHLNGRRNAILTLI